MPAHPPPPKVGVDVKRLRIDKRAAIPPIKACPNPSKNLPTEFGKCDFDLFDDIEYMPDASFLQASIDAAHSAWGDDSDKLHRRWFELQNPQDCNHPSSSDLSEPNYKIIDEDTGERVPATPRQGSPKWHLVRFLAHGYGYNLFMMAMNAGSHWASGVPVLPSNSNYRYNGGGKCGSGWSCYMSPLSRCILHKDVSSANVLVYTQESSRLAYTLTNVCGPGGKLNKKWGRCECDSGFVPDNNYPRYFNCIPTKLYGEGKMDYVKTYHSFTRGEALKTAATGHRWFKKSPGEENPHGLSDPYADISRKVPPELRRHGLIWWLGEVLWHLHRDAPARTSLQMLSHHGALKGATALRCTCGGVMPVAIECSGISGALNGPNIVKKWMRW